MTDALAANLVHFVRYLRAKGLSVVPHTAFDLANAVGVVGLSDREDVYYAFRSVATARPSDVAAFDEGFELFFGSGRVARRGPLDEIDLKIWDRSKARARAPVLATHSSFGDGARDDVEDVTGASQSERLMHKDFGELTPEEKEDVRRLIARMIWSPAKTPSRRWTPNRRGRRPHLRRTFRRLVSPEGDLMPLAFAGRRPRRRPLIVVADVSGSMERYTEMFLYFIHAAQGRLGRVEAFVFSTQLTRITRPIRQRQPESALRTVAGAVPDWSGGTRIGNAIAEFNNSWSRRVTRGGSIALVISDGWDTGDPGLLAAEMSRFARAVHRVIWLNPLAGRPGYQPEARGMRSVLPYVDDFLSAANVLDLREVVRLLESVPSRRRGFEW